MREIFNSSEIKALRECDGHRFANSFFLLGFCELVQFGTPVIGFAPVTSHFENGFEIDLSALFQTIDRLSETHSPKSGQFFYGLVEAIDISCAALANQRAIPGYTEFTLDLPQVLYRLVGVLGQVSYRGGTLKCILRCLETLLNANPKVIAPEDYSDIISTVLAVLDRSFYRESTRSITPDGSTNFSSLNTSLSDLLGRCSIDSLGARYANLMKLIREKSDQERAVIEHNVPAGKIINCMPINWSRSEVTP